MVSVRVLAPADLSATEVADWHRLLAVNPALNSPYLTPEYAQLVAAVRPHDSRVAVVEEAGVIIAFLPFRLHGGIALPLGAPMCDVQGLIVAPDKRIDIPALLQGMGVSRFDADHWLGAQGHMLSAAYEVKQAHILDMSAGFATYQAARAEAGSKLFQRVAKKARKIERELGPIRIGVSCDAGDFAQLLAWKEAQYTATRTVNIFNWPWTKAVLQRAFETETPAFSGKLYTLHIGDHLAAAAFNLATPDVLHAWFVAYDTALSAHSPGQILFVKMAEHAAGTGIKILDLGAGDYRFKTELASGHVDVVAGSLGRARWSMAASRGVSALPLGAVSRLPSRVMRRLDMYRTLAD